MSRTVHALLPADAKGGSARIVVPHVDDLGASHEANIAFLRFADAGQVTCGSVMVPGPWFREIAEAAVTDPALDVGVHLTLTSEWDLCRWAPISTTSRASGLIDDDGYFWRSLDLLAQHLVPEAVEAELRAQIERAVAAGIRPTHIDAHMAAAMLPGILDKHIGLGREYGLFPVLPRTIDWAPDPGAYRAAVLELDRAGLPIVDHCRGTLPVERDRLADGWRALLDTLPHGLTHLALHCTAPSEAFAHLTPRHAAWRFAEYELIAAGTLGELLIAADVQAIGTRALQHLWLSGAPDLHAELLPSTQHDDRNH